VVSGDIARPPRKLSRKTKKPQLVKVAAVLNGGESRNRTEDTRIFSPYVRCGNQGVARVAVRFSCFLAFRAYRISGSRWALLALGGGQRLVVMKQNPLQAALEIALALLTEEQRKEYGRAIAASYLSELAFQKPSLRSDRPLSRAACPEQ